MFNKAIREIQMFLGDEFGTGSDRLMDLVNKSSERAYINSVFEFMSSVHLSRCESPIEQLMVFGFLSENRKRDIDVEITYIPTPYQDHENLLTETREYRTNDRKVYVYPQVIVDKYRVDFMAYGIKSTLAIECDGHEFHERTKEQASRDKARDRDLLCLGVPVMRFTGSEIFKDPHACALKAGEYFLEAETAEFDDIEF